MSGSFTQRGGFAVTDKLSRAEMAVRCGADLVLEAPTVWAMSTAERFAQGGVDILTRTGVVTELVFGSECGDIAALRRAADALESPQVRMAGVERIVFTDDARNRHRRPPPPISYSDYT